MTNARGREARVLRPRILDLLSETVPLSTTEIVVGVRAAVEAEGGSRDIRGPLIRLPARHSCRECGHGHDCADWLHISSMLIKPQLDAMAKAGLVIKVSRGTARACLWLAAGLVIPDTVDELLGPTTPGE